MTSSLLLEEIEYICLSKTSPAFARIKVHGTQAQKAGKKYEREVLLAFFEKFTGFIPLPWFCYKLKGETRERWFQPDGLLIDFMKGQIIVIECKIRHMSEAFSKMDKLYLPLLRIAFPEKFWTLYGLEVTKTYDCAVKVPVPIKICKSVYDVLSGKYGVLVWNKQKIFQ